MDKAHIKVIVTDLDGTLLNDNKEISQENIDALIHAQEQGYKVVIATGRGFTMIQKYAKQIKLDEYGGYVVGFNGQHVYEFESKTFHESHEIEPKLVSKVLKFARKHQLQLVMEKKDTYYTYTPLSLFPMTIAISYAKLRRKQLKKQNQEYHVFTKYSVPSQMKMVTIKREHDFYEAMPKMGLSQLPYKLNKKKELILETFDSLLEVSQVAPFWFDLVPLGTNKGEGLQWVSDRLGVSLAQFVAFGDAENDMHMLSRVGVGIAMKNAMPHVQSMVDYVSEYSNNESGVGKIVKKIIKGTFVV